MTEIPESHRDLLGAPVAVLATQGADGYPQVSALWFVFDEDGLTMSLNNTRQKVKNLSQHPECTLFILDPSNPYRTVEIRARAEIVPDIEGVVVAKVQAKYGADVRANDRPGESRLAVTLNPVKVNTWG
jgi:PPOX class probable F420-dependent enzyme